MLKSYVADLHIHTCLSPCAAIDMTPKRIIKRAVEQGLQIIAVTDHNSVENFPALKELAKEITVLPGMEVTTREEVHLLALMPDYESAVQLQELIYRYLPVTKNSRISFEQMVVNAEGQLLHFNERSLIEPVDLGLDEMVDFIHSLGGLAIPSHIDRELYGILYGLGRIPEEIPFDGLEISYRTPPERAKSLYAEYSHLPWLWSSDAHQLEQIGRARSRFLLKEPSLEELSLALKA
ncbi:MAG: PHP domain-containing protein, partial [Nitrospirae bacterium]